MSATAPKITTAPKIIPNVGIKPKNAEIASVMLASAPAAAPVNEPVAVSCDRINNPTAPTTPTTTRTTTNVFASEI